MLPDETQCKACRFFDIANAYVKQQMELAGRDLATAACRCPEKEREMKRAAQTRIIESNLPHEVAGHRRLFENFSPRTGTPKALEAVKQFSVFPSQHKGPRILTLEGQTGSGKTHLLEAAARTLVGHGFTVRYELAAAYIDRYRASNARGGDSDGMDSSKLDRWYEAFFCVVLDDLGLERANDFATEKVAVLIESRLQHGGMLLIATNQSFSEITEQYGSRVASRMWDMSDGATSGLVTITATDYRVA